MTERDLFYMTIHGMRFLRTKEKVLLEGVMDSPGELARLEKKDIEKVVGRRFRAAPAGISVLMSRAEAALRCLETLGASLIHLYDPEYPPQLREIYDPPYLLFCRGSMPSPLSPLLGIVGTRYPSGSGRKAAFRLAVEAGAGGAGIVSGLARGIDSEAHRGAVRNGSYTCAVMGTGVDEIYPREHKSLAREILNSGGGLLTEYLPSTPPMKHHFPERNRILSGLCRGVAIIEAPARSGALITADFALEQGRDIFVHEEGMKPLTGDGTMALAEDGAIVIREADSIFREWGVEPRKTGVMPGNCDAGGNTGRMLAEFLEEELTGNVLLHQGVCIRR